MSWATTWLVVIVFIQTQASSHVLAWRVLPDNIGQYQVFGVIASIIAGVLTIIGVLLFADTMYIGASYIMFVGNHQSLPYHHQSHHHHIHLFNTISALISSTYVCHDSIIILMYRRVRVADRDIFN